MKFFPFGLNSVSESGSVELLGGKGAGLVWLANEGVPVPPGFIIPTSVWAEYDQKPKSTMKAIAKALPAYLAQLEAHFGYLPLLSVRSGARVSCPGMMDTILNVGIDEATTATWAQRLGPQCFGDSLHRLVTMYGSVVAGIRKESMGSTLASALDAYTHKTNEAFPNAEAQLLTSIEAVFQSWDNERAEEYRKMHGYAREWGTAVTVQAMVFGNLNDQSATGVLFTRNPDTGNCKVTGEWLPNAQGEDIVAGIRTPQALDAMYQWNSTLHVELIETVQKLEGLKQDMLDIEWTVQDGKLYLLQVRSGKRSAQAAIKIAVDLVAQGLIDAKTATQRVTPKQFDLAQLASLDPKWTKKAAFTGIPACSGIVTGKPVFTKEDAINCTEPCILVVEFTDPKDIAGMYAAKGVITMVGGLTSHAAVVARAMDRACIVGVGQSVEAFKDVEVVSMDAATGRIWTEAVPVVAGSTNGALTTFQTLVFSALNAVPVLTAVPKHAMPEALLSLGDQILDLPKAVATVQDTLEKVGKVYLDLTASAEEAKFLALVKAHDHTSRLLDLLSQALYMPQAKRLTVITPDEYTAGFTRLVPGGDLRSLVLADTEMVLNGVDVTDAAVKRVVEWKQSLGVSVVSLGAYVADAKSIISIGHALQTIHGGK